MAEKDTDSITHLQVLTLTLLHPMKGDKIVRDMVGRAFFDPEELDYDSYGAEDLKYSLKIDPPYYSEKHDQYFDTYFFKLWHPETGEVSERSFICRSFFTIEELEEFGSIKFAKIFYDLEFRKPYVPHFDDENVAMHRHKTDLVREALATENE